MEQNQNEEVMKNEQSWVTEWQRWNTNMEENFSDIKKQKKYSFHPFSRKWMKTHPIFVFIMSVLLLMTLVTLIYSVWFHPVRSNQSTNEQNSINLSADAIDSMNGVMQNDVPHILVDVHGDVRHPGVYQLLQDARVIDAVRAAGGFLHETDRNSIDEAESLIDGQEIWIGNPKQSASDTASVSGDGTAPTSVSSQSLMKNGQNETVYTTKRKGNSLNPNGIFGNSARVDLNTASVATLETIPGIGAKRANEIVQYRLNHGGFHSLEDLRKIKGIGPKLFSKITLYAVVS